MLKRLGSLFRRKPKSPPRNRSPNGAKTQSPRKSASPVRQAPRTRQSLRNRVMARITVINTNGKRKIVYVSPENMNRNYVYNWRAKAYRRRN